MAEPEQSNSSFSRAFLPGLVVGLIIGLAIGAFVPPLLDRAPTIQPSKGGSGSQNVNTPSERDPRPADPSPIPGEIPSNTPAPAPAPSPAPSAVPPPR